MVPIKKAQTSPYTNAHCTHKKMIKKHSHSEKKKEGGNFPAGGARLGGGYLLSARLHIMYARYIFFSPS